jgi:hypothetical protein
VGLIAGSTVLHYVLFAPHLCITPGDYNAFFFTPECPKIIGDCALICGSSRSNTSLMAAIDPKKLRPRGAEAHVTFRREHR